MWFICFTELDSRKEWAKASLHLHSPHIAKTSPVISSQKCFSKYPLQSPYKLYRLQERGIQGQSHTVCHLKHTLVSFRRIFWQHKFILCWVCNWMKHYFMLGVGCSSGQFLRHITQPCLCQWRQQWVSEKLPRQKH